jgi:hypothetical protein
MPKVDDYEICACVQLRPQFFGRDTCHAQRAQEPTALCVLPSDVSHKCRDGQYKQEHTETRSISDHVFQLIAKDVTEQFERPYPKENAYSIKEEEL